MGEEHKFVGRDDELHIVRSAVDSAAAGRGRLVLIGGEPGIGKTRLAELAAEHATAQGMTVLWGSCWDGDSGPGYWPWIQVLRALASGNQLSTMVAELGPAAGELARLVEAPVDDRPTSTSEAEGARFRLFDTMGRALVVAARSTPLLVVLDDLQWADRPSLAMLGFVARLVRQAGVLVIGTYRDDEPTEDGRLAGFLTESGRDAIRLDLAGLSVSEVGELVMDTGRGAELQAMTGGNPFFVHELSKLLAQGDRVHWAVPASVRDVLHRRLARLGPRSVRVLEAAAVVGQNFGVDLLCGATGLQRREVVELLDEPVDAGLVRRDRDSVARFTFCHALLRQTLYDRPTALRRAELHRRVGEALETDVARPDEVAAALAHHFVEAIDAGTADEAVRYSRLAGETALARLAYEEAVRHFRRAVDVHAISPRPDDRLRVELLLSLGQAQRWAGQTDAGRETFAALAAAARELGDPQLLAEAALGFGAPQLDIGIGVVAPDSATLEKFEEALAALGNEPSVLRSRLLSTMAFEYYVVDPERCRALAREAATVASQVGDARAAVMAAAVETTFLAGTPQAENVLAKAQDLVKAANDVGDVRTAMIGRGLALWGRLWSGHASAAQREIEAYRRSADRLGIGAYGYPLSVWSTMRTLLDGRLDDAERSAQQALGSSVPWGYGDHAYVTFAAQLFAIRREQGRIAELEDAIRAVIGRPGFADEGAAYLAVLLTELGRLGEAGDVLRRVDVRAFTEGLRHWEWPNIWYHLALACAGVGDDQLAHRLYELGLPYSTGCVIVGPTALVAGPIDHALGLLAGLLGRWSDVDSHFEIALGRCARLGSPPLLARTRCDYARVLIARAGPGDLDRAGELVGQAKPVAEELGMVALAERASATQKELEQAASPPTHVFRRDGDVWMVAYGDEHASLKDAKGLRDLAVLLAAPGREVHVSELLADELARAAASMGSDATLDDQAKAAYQARLGELQDGIAEAEGNHDFERVARIEAERDVIVDQLAKAAGLGGRARALGDETERIRKTVTVRIRRAIRMIESQLPGLGAHLRDCVQTGTYCCYRPGGPTTWRM